MDDFFLKTGTVLILFAHGQTSISLDTLKQIRQTNCIYESLFSYLEAHTNIKSKMFKDENDTFPQTIFL